MKAFRTEASVNGGETWETQPGEFTLAGWDTEAAARFAAHTHVALLKLAGYDARVTETDRQENGS